MHDLLRAVQQLKRQNEGAPPQNTPPQQNAPPFVLRAISVVG